MVSAGGYFLRLLRRLLRRRSWENLHWRLYYLNLSLRRSFDLGHGDARQRSLHYGVTFFLFLLLVALLHAALHNSFIDVKAFLNEWVFCVDLYSLLELPHEVEQHFERVERREREPKTGEAALNASLEET